MTRKFSSCSTIFIDDSTVSQPNLKNTIRAVALAVYFHIKNRNRGINGSVYATDELDDRLVDIFDEKLHPLSVSETDSHLVACSMFKFDVFEKLDPLSVSETDSHLVWLVACLSLMCFGRIDSQD